MAMARGWGSDVLVPESRPIPEGPHGPEGPVATALASDPGGDFGDGEDDSPGQGQRAVLPRWIWWTGGALLGAQLVAMLAFSTTQYSRYALTEDFANYSQAWWAIAHGHLDPFITGFANNRGGSFWRDNAEFVLYPLALLYYIDPHPVVLLWVQDLVVVITNLVTLRWIVSVLESGKGRTAKRAGPWLALAALTVLVVNPWAYETIAFDFHFEPIAAMFCVLVGYNLWAGKTRRLWWLVPLALISHVLAGTYLVGIGLSAMVAGRRTRRPGAAVAAVGLAWVVILAAFGAAGDDGHYVGASYGYLTGTHPGRVGLWDVVVGALGHPGAALHVAGSHWSVVLIVLLIGGVAGVASPWGFGMALVVLGPNMLDGSGIFIRFSTAFQSWPAMPFILVGSVMVLLRILQRGETGRRIVVVLMTLWMVVLGEIALVALPGIPRGWLSVDTSTAAALARIEPTIPAGAEVVSTGAVIGRFGERDAVYGFLTPGETIAVTRREVVFIFTPNEILDGNLSSRAAMAAEAFVRDRLDARVLGSAPGVDVLAWSSPRGTTQVTLP